MWQKFTHFVRISWKAVVALAVPILMGAAADILTAFGEWITTQGFTWGGVATGIIASIAVWLKANAAD